MAHRQKIIFSVAVLVIAIQSTQCIPHKRLVVGGGVHIPAQFENSGVKTQVQITSAQHGGGGGGGGGGGIGGIFGQLGNTMKGAVDAVAGAAGGLAKTAVNVATGIAGQAIQTGLGVMTGVVDTAVKGVGQLGQAITGAAGGSGGGGGGGSHKETIITHERVVEVSGQQKNTDSSAIDALTAIAELGAQLDKESKGGSSGSYSIKG